LGRIAGVKLVGRTKRELMERIRKRRAQRMTGKYIGAVVALLILFLGATSYLSSVVGWEIISQDTLLLIVGVLILTAFVFYVISWKISAMQEN
jgi:uncharacterized protein YacL